MSVLRNTYSSGKFIYSHTDTRSETPQQLFSKRKMRSTSRLFAVVKSERFLTPGNPTGLTGLLTHPAPRSQLIYLYSSTLDKLSKIPEHSVYRQSAEAITRQRLNIINGFKPPGYEEWAQRAKQKIDEHPNVFGKDREPSTVFMSAQLTEERDQRDVQWDNRK